jgi:cell volume regulation protein A
MAIGSDGMGWIDFADYRLARLLGTIALAVVLFEGGLTSGWRTIRPVLGPSIALATIGTVVTAAICGLAASWLFGLSLKGGLLLGAIVASTDGAAVFGILRGSALRPRLGRTLEAEAGFNDPVAVLLVLACIAWIKDPGYGIADAALLFAREIGIGTVVGVGLGAIAVRLLQRARWVDTSYEGLYPVASIAVAALAYGGAATLHGSGFLAVYLAGLAIGGAEVPGRSAITNFHVGLAWVAQVSMFLMLGLLVFPSQLPEVALRGTALALVLAFVARPVAVLLATPGAGFTRPERLTLGWAGLRGAVPVVLATFPIIEGVGGSVDRFNVVFFAVLVSTILQGSTFELVARWLGVAREPQRPQTGQGELPDRA